MAQRANEDYPRVLLIESDSEVVDQITGVLSDYALTIEVINDGADVLAKAQASPPALILLCVELPDGKNGYALCNKIRKKSPLKDVPLLVLSSEGSAEIFEQHGGLKTRANAYLHKPLDLQQLVANISNVMDLHPLDNDGGTHPEFGAEGPLEDTSLSPLATNVVEEAALAEEAPAPIDAVLSAIDQEVGPEPDPETDREPEEVSTGVDVDLDIDLETDAAFAAMEVEGESNPDDKPIVITAAEATFDPRLKAAGEPQVAPEVAPLDVPEGDDEDLIVESTSLMAEENAAGPPPVPAEPESTADDGAAPIDDVAPRASEVLSLKDRVAELELDNKDLTEKLRNAQSSGPSSRDREMLNLREIINRKEKEILDLKDGVDGKERQILDQKEKVHELQRKASEMDDRLLGLERELMDGNETVSALKEDKNKAVEREASVKARLEEAKAEIDKAYEDNDSLRARHSEETEALRTELKSEIKAKEAEFTQALADKDQAAESEKETLAANHLQALQDQANAGQQDLESLRATENAARHDLGLEHEAAIEELKKGFEDEKSTLQADHRAAAENTQREHEEAIAKERGESAQRLNEMQDSALADMERQESDFATQTAQLKEANAEALRLEQERSARALETREAEHAGEKELMRTEHQSEIENLKRKSDEAQSKAEQTHQNAMDSLKQFHESQIDELKGEHRQSISELQDELNKVRDDLTGRLEAKEAEAETLTGDLKRSDQGRRDAERSLEEARDNAERSERSYRDAKTQLANDAELADKAKRAMAIAITLLEEQQSSSNGTGASLGGSGDSA
jgi:CheY-like chemotaxis protein